ncbi:MAG: 23S rRNA (pseudouridine(1915)-N(3))-methyltransferase RlmH [Bacteroidales bacterium]|nr:23S rRNA (pseudouridine(1915)-N(3))-methyltransferase RlmH [Bacteroidales bacterium]
MKVTLLTVGKTDIPWVKAGLEMYAARLGHYLKFAVSEIPELKGVGALSEEQIKEKEGELILKAAGQADLVLLDERGQQLRSVEFAAELQKRLNRGRDLTFVVGGAYGFSKAVYDRAAGMISLSKMTFSHQIVRAIFAEQLYRACTIIKGEPYHHE